MADIGKRIKERREAIGMTQEELASKLGYKSKSSIAKIETGTNDIVQSKVSEFADVLNTSISYLMGWEKEDLKADFLFKTYTDPEIEILIEQYSRLDSESKNYLKKYMELLLLNSDKKKEND